MFKRNLSDNDWSGQPLVSLFGNQADLENVEKFTTTLPRLGIHVARLSRATYRPVISLVFSSVIGVLVRFILRFTSFRHGSLL